MKIIKLWLLLVIGLLAVSACASSAAPAGGSTSAVTTANTSGQIQALACSNGATSAPLTAELTEGPYFKANSPQRAALIEDGMPGTKIVISGYVYSVDCKPLANALLDFWQANANGQYDNTGFTLRGHQYSDANGHYALTTVVPGLYPGRTEHIHVKVQAQGGRLITSQLFFPGVQQNDSDGIFVQSMLLSVQQASDGLQARFNFVVPLS